MHWVSYCTFAVAEFKLLHRISPTIFPNQQDITSSLMSKLSNESNKGQIRPAGVARFALEVCGRLMFLILYSMRNISCPFSCLSKVWPLWKKDKVSDRLKLKLRLIGRSDVSNRPMRLVMEGPYSFKQSILSQQISIIFALSEFIKLSLTILYFKLHK